jgi:hypothetical protein
MEEMRRTVRRTLGVLICLAIASPSARASIGTLPLADTKTMAGTWEGISSDEPRLFVLHVDPAGTSSIDMAYGEQPHVMRFRVTSLKVSKGAVTLNGVSTGPEAVPIRINGTARAFRGEGRMKAKVSLSPDDNPATWDVEMILRPGGYLAQLWKLHSAAAPTSPPTGP